MKWAPNPYTIAQLLADRPDIEPLYTADGSSVDEFLRTAFLSSGKQKSMTDALAVYQRVAESSKTPVTLADAMRSPNVTRAADEHAGDRIQRLLPALLEISDATFGGALFTDAEQLMIEDVTYLDPVQGAVGDCYLIAAMIALAWTIPASLTTRLGTSGFSPRTARLFSWTFHTDEGQERGRPTVSGRIPMAGKLPRYAHSSERNESWPAMLEKAFVIKQRAGVAGNHEPTPAEYQSLNRETTPPLACQALVGGEVKGEQLDTPRGGQVFSERTLLGEPGPLHSTSGIMSRPVMAWTFENIGTSDHELWESTGLWPNHAYAVLGVMKEAGVEHVVLRNPHGVATKRRDGYAAGPWTPADRSVKLNEKGVFAIKNALFFENFQHIGWIDLASTA